MSENMVSFLSGAAAMGSFVIAMFFWRFWRRTHDRLFAGFATAFVMFGLERVVLELVDPLAERRPYIYLIRLTAFVLIGLSILEKNRAPRATGVVEPIRSSRAGRRSAN